MRLENSYGIDLGTGMVKIYDQKADHITQESTMIALRNGNQVFAVGNDAYSMFEKAPADVRIIRPVSNGRINDILMTEEGLDFRATKDIDLVLIIEAVDANFGKKFWEYVKQAGYEHCNKSSGVPQFYRFSHPITNQYPAMIELFTRKLDAIQLPKDAVLTPLPMDEDISSLSAILLDDDYYEFLKQGKVTVDGVTVLDAAYLIPFKAKAWMDLTDRKAAGEHVDSKNIKKHKNDVFRLTELIDPTAKVVAPQGVYADIQEFVQRMKNENVDIKQLGLVGRTKEKILEELKAMYETL